MMVNSLMKADAPRQRASTDDGEAYSEFPSVPTTKPSPTKPLPDEAVQGSTAANTVATTQAQAQSTSPVATPARSPTAQLPAFPSMIENLAASEGPVCLAYVQERIRQQTPITEAGLVRHGMNALDAKLFGERRVRAERDENVSATQAERPAAYPSLFRSESASTAALAFRRRDEVGTGAHSSHVVTSLSKEAWETLRKDQGRRRAPSRGVTANDIARPLLAAGGAGGSVFGGVMGALLAASWFEAGATTEAGAGAMIGSFAAVKLGALLAGRVRLAPSRLFDAVHELDRCAFPLA